MYPCWCKHWFLQVLFRNLQLLPAQHGFTFTTLGWRGTPWMSQHIFAGPTWKGPSAIHHLRYMLTRSYNQWKYDFCRETETHECSEMSWACQIENAWLIDWTSLWRLRSSSHTLDVRTDLCDHQVSTDFYFLPSTMKNTSIDFGVNWCIISQMWYI